MVNLPNQKIIPSSGQAAAQQASPTLRALPYATGAPPEGPQSALTFITIPAGQTTGVLSVGLSQFGMSMVQSLLIDNETNGVGISVKPSGGLNFAISAFGTQIVPLFQKGTTLTLNVTLAAVQASDTLISFQIFNSFVPPASWVANLSVSGNVNVASVSGNINVVVGNLNLLGVSIQAQAIGGATGFLALALTNAAVQVKTASGPATLKGFSGQSAALGWLQFFDIQTPGQVTLGATVPTFSFPVGPVNTPIQQDLPPEGLMCNNGLSVAWTTTVNGAAAPAANFDGTIFYA